MKRKQQLNALAAACGTTSKCPYCEVEPEKIPKRKAKCKSCKKPIYPRKDPVSGESRLYREGDLFLLEELKALSDGWWEGWYKENKGVLSARKDLAKEWNIDEVDVSVGDAKWRDSHTRIAEGTEKKDWDKVYCSYQSMLRQVQSEKSEAKTPLPELVAAFMITGYGRTDNYGSNTIGRPQFMLIDQLTTNPDEVYDLIKDTTAAESYSRLMGVTLDTIIKRYKNELKEEAEMVEEMRRIETSNSSSTSHSEKKGFPKSVLFLLGLIGLSIAIAAIR
ncbi:hypothetical protein SAMN05216262_13119 [Colwellia chukchiensis]|uniref:Uncharacterized protein n=1 Tax=Colwellia chukchiensis TaxID=641665 RepID=A0A1H7U0B8_9GAMM|nr:hypothetical protein [Colwellia chukchiensis]SEL90245.1 hypothetical protein SAMN05216262_13119 [Colwellia chukchiensis]